MSKEKTENTDNKQKPWLFQKGQSGNPAGKPKGAKNFKTIFEKAVRKIAKERGVKKCDIEIDLVIRAIAEARGGNYKYYNDIFNRVYGMPKQTFGLDPEDTISEIEIKIKKNETNSRRRQKYNESISKKSGRASEKKE
jgi:hypothetical protein